MAVGVVVEQALAEPDHALEAEVVLKPALDVLVGRAGVAVRVEQALLGRDDGARSVVVDRAAFEHPVGLGVGQGGGLRDPLADVLVAFEVVLVAPAVEAETLRPALLARAHDDRPAVAQPDVAEILDDDGREWRELARAVSAASSCAATSQTCSPLPSAWTAFGEGRDFALGLLKVRQPQLRVARKADPDRFVRSPFGRADDAAAGSWRAPSNRKQKGRPRRAAPFDRTDRKISANRIR